MWFTNSRQYDVLKNIAQIYLPAAGTLYFALAQIWGLPATEEVTGTVVAVDTFLGVVLGISSVSYKASGAKYDGSMFVERMNSGEGRTFTLELNVDPEKLVDKEAIVFKVIPE